MFCHVLIFVMAEKRRVPVESLDENYTHTLLEVLDSHP
jgi:hypothetical protein